METNGEAADRKTKNKMAEWCLCDDMKVMNVKNLKEMALYILG